MQNTIKLFKYYWLWKAENPDLVSPASPSQRVGAKPIDEFKKVEHSVKMLSLAECVFTARQLMISLNKAATRMEGQPSSLAIFSEPKLDGLAITIHL